VALYTSELGYKKDRRWQLAGLLAVALVSVFSVGIYIYTKPQPTNLAVELNSRVNALPDHQQKLITPLPWPEYGQAAYGVVDEGVLAESNNSQQAVPVASLAKIITALAVLDKKPLEPGEQGPSIILTEQDVKIYQDYVAKNGSVVPVKAGVSLSQYQALQAMLMPSANNIADSLVIWAFGSIDEYNQYANNMLRELGINNTTVADASGYSPATKSTAEDMVRLGILYLKNPLLRDIAMQPEATIAYAGLIRNYNSTINNGEILGLKIGYTDEAGRAFLVADIRDGKLEEASVVAVIGADNLPTAMKDAKVLLEVGNLGHDLIKKS